MTGMLYLVPDSLKTVTQIDPLKVENGR